MKRKVPFFEYPRIFTDHEEDFISILRDIGNRGAFIMQQDLTYFETKLAHFTGAKYALGVANATDALQILLMASDLEKDDEIIICSHTMIATASAIHHAGYIPVPVEVGPDRLIDYEDIERAITPRTKAIMPTQLNGRTANMEIILRIAEEHQLSVFEDSAQALGSKFKGQHAGTFGQGGAISFYPAKVLGCLGDGGAILTNHQDIYDKSYQIRDHGRTPDGAIKLWGLNSRLDNLQAAFLSFQLDKYPTVIERRRQAAAIYDARLNHLKQLQLPPKPSTNSDHFDVYQNYEIIAESRDNLIGHLQEEGIGTLIQWGGIAIHQFRNLGFKQSLPKTDNFFSNCLMLPLNATASDEDYHYVCDCIVSFYSR